VISGRQGIVFGIADEYGEQLRRFSLLALRLIK